MTEEPFALAPPPSRQQLFVGFLMLGLVSFGGALPHARRAIVEKRRWLSPDDFVELLGLCQFLPGGNIINLSVAVGMKFRGVGGALAALLGMVAGPSMIVVLLGMIYEHTQDDPRVRHMFTGLAAAAAGLLVSMAVRIAMPVLRKARAAPAAAVIAALAFVAIALLRFPLVPTMLTLMPLSIYLASRIKR